MIKESLNLYSIHLWDYYGDQYHYEFKSRKELINYIINRELDGICKFEVKYIGDNSKYPGLYKER